jgi:hypothetical protein
MGIIMVVQTITKKSEAIDVVDIPDEMPPELLENDSLLLLEKDLNKLENRISLTARTVLGMNKEMQTQIFEIDRIENAITSMHDFIVGQQVRIEQLEIDVDRFKNAKQFRKGNLMSKIRERLFSE